MSIKGKKIKTIVISIVLLAIAIFIFFKIKNNGRKVEILPQVSANVETESEKDTVINDLFFEHLYTLEESENLENLQTIYDGKSFSGKNSSRLNPTNEYGITYKKKFSEVKNYENIQKVNYSLHIYTDNPLNEVYTVMSIEGPDKKNVDWQSQLLVAGKGKWIELEFTFDLKGKSNSADNIISIYVWNKEKNTFYLDDIKISYWGPTLVSGAEQVKVPEKNISYGFESLLPNESDSSTFTSNEFHSGKHSFHFTSERAYGPSIIRKVSDVADGELKLITLSVWIKTVSDNPEATLVVNTKSEKGTEITYDARGTQSEKGKFVKGEWKKLRAQFKLPAEKLHPEDYIVVYIWNKSGSEFYADDLEIVYGEQHTRGGSEPVVNTAILGKEGLNFERNKYPFHVKYLHKMEMGNNDSESLIMKDNTSKIAPYDAMASGLFFDSPEKTNQLLWFSNSSLHVYKYCNSNHHFYLAFYEEIKNLPVWAKNASIAKGDFDGDGIDEAILYNEQAGQSIVIQFPHITISGCNSQGNQNKLCKISNVLFQNENTTVDSHQKLICADFNNDRKCDIVIVKPSLSSFTFITFEKPFDKPSSFENKSSQLDFISANKNFNLSSLYIESVKKNCLVISTKSNGINFVKFYTLNKSGNELTVYSGIEDEHFIGSNSQLFSGNFRSENNHDFLILNRDWKFDLKLASIDQKGLLIQNTIDFTGFIPGQNPKYYECIRMILGCYTQKGKIECLIIIRNCGDSNFNGIKCRNYSRDQLLPPSIQLYSF